MAVSNIFAVDERAQKESKPREDFVGRVRSGYQENGQPRSLEAFRLTVTNVEAADQIAAAYGGETSEWDTKSGEIYEVFTDATSLDIVVASPKSIQTNMVLWGRTKQIRSCDGATQKDGTPCVCPSALAERKAAAKNETGCTPNIFLAFTLAKLPEIGTLKYTSSAWTALEQFSKAEEAVAAFDGPVSLTLGIEKVSFEKDGQTITYSKPTITVNGLAEESF